MFCLTSLLPPWAHWKLKLCEAVSRIPANIPTQVLCLFFLPESNPGEGGNHLPAVNQQEIRVGGSISQPPNRQWDDSESCFPYSFQKVSKGDLAIVVTHPVTVTGFSLFCVSLFPFLSTCFLGSPSKQTVCSKSLSQVRVPRKLGRGWKNVGAMANQGWEIITVKKDIVLKNQSPGLRVAVSRK